MGTLLQTKLYLPESSSDAVSRPRLLRQLSAGLHAKLALICAPAGFGKTTIAAAWLHSLLAEEQVRGEARYAAWYTIDEYDNDLASFAAYLVAAIQRACPGLLAGWIDLDRRTSAPEPEDVAAEVIEALESVDGRLLVALDDYHLITDAAVHRFTTYLLRQLPLSVHVILTARYEPPIGIAQLRSRRQIVEVRGADLSFTLNEANTFLHNALGDDLGAVDVDTLWQHTEGWVAGLRLAAISLHASQDRALFMQRFAQASIRHVADYLVDQVLATQPPPVHDFLLQTSILSRLSHDLCAAVAPQHRDAKMHILDYLDRSNLFLIALDDFGEWYRYHGQFRSMLHRRLVDQCASGEVALLHRRAAEWLASHGDMDEAVAHYVAAREADKAALLVEGLMRDLLRREQWRQATRLLALLPAEMVERRPALLLLRAWIYVQAFNLAQIRSLVDQAERLLQEQEACSDGAGAAESAALRGQIYALRARANLGYTSREACQAMGYEALRLLPPAYPWARAYTYNALSTAALLLDGYAAGRRVLEDEIAAHAGMRTEYMVGLYFPLAVLDYSAGRIDAFALSASYFDGLVRELDIPSEIQMAHCMLGLLLLERNDPAGGFERLAAVAKRPDLTHILALRVTAYRLLVWYAEQKLIEPGSELVSVLRRRLEKNPDPEGAAETAAFEAFWAALTGDRAAAEHYLRQAPPDTPVLHLAHRGLIRIRICQLLRRPEDLEQATELAQRQSEAARQYSYLHVEVEALVLLAQTYWLRDLPVRALAALRQAVNRGYEHGIRYVFCNSRPSLGPMLYRLAAEPAFAAPAAHLLAEIARLAGLRDGALPDGECSAAGAVGHKQEIVPLSERESEILALLAKGMKNQVIADCLHISLNTVRNHTVSIYRKLDVQNRREALERARLWGLVA